ncbi:hypothetical protein niasHT_038145 [Heterodera trifolii]|uniref:Uncharacterized protein n=1 Tax=Heterodera trifolii TaxID=157864 RepID=A0ABD2I9P2_9BILA
MHNHAPTDENEIPNIGKAERDAIGPFGHDHPRNSDTETEKPAHGFDIVDQLSLIGALFFGQLLTAILINHPSGKIEIRLFQSLIIVLVGIVVSVEAPSFGAGVYTKITS